MILIPLQREGEKLNSIFREDRGPASHPETQHQLSPSLPPSKDKQEQAIANPIQGQGKGDPEAEGKLFVNTLWAQDLGSWNPVAFSQGLHWSSLDQGQG